jgi:CheY-like chemotaxis protein
MSDQWYQTCHPHIGPPEVCLGLRAEMQPSTPMLASTPSILITDDDHDFRETLRVVFEPRGYHTILASTGEEALRIVLSQEVHLLLMDMHMPKWTGLETIRRVKKFRSRLPCILLSAGLDDAIVHQAQVADVFTVLRKPVSREQVTTAVESAFRRTYSWVTPQESEDARNQ